MRSGILLITILSIAAMSSPSLAANYFKWTDENGVTHYSARKPVGQEAQVVRISAGGRSTPQQEETPQPIASENTSTEQTADNSAALQDEERCNWGRTTLQVLRNHNRVRAQGDNGELRYLTEEEKADQRQQAEQAVQESC